MRTLLRFLRLFYIIILMGLTILQPSPKPVMADVTITVNTTTDELNSDGDCSLREAVRASITNSAVDACPAGSSSDTDEIVLPAGVYTLTITGASENDTQTGDLDLKGKIHLVGAGREATTVQGGSGWDDRIFQIFYEIAGTEITFEKMTIQNGQTPLNDNGGGIHVFGTSSPGDVVVNLKEVRLQNNRAIANDISNGTGGGLGITNTPTITILDSLIQNNSGRRGGGVFVAKATIKRSVFTGNQAISGSALYIVQTQPALIENTTISGNGIGSDYPSQNYVIVANYNPTVTIRYSTITNNNTYSNFGGVYLGSGQIILQGTILSGNAINNCTTYSSPITSNGYNLSSDSSCNTYLNQSSDLNGTDALLNPLGFYGKTLPHHPPKPGSPAVTNPGSSCPAEDQLGTVRPASSCTRGAVQNALALLYLPVVTK